MPDSSRLRQRFAVLLCAIAVILVAGACGGSEASERPTRDWGPLAVDSGPPTGAEALTQGTLSIEPRCVTLKAANGSASLLVWPESFVEWNGEQNAIRVDDPQMSEPVLLRSGSTVSFAGGGNSPAESGESFDDLMARTAWVSPPTSECLTEIESIFYVGSVVDPGDQ